MKMKVEMRGEFEKFPKCDHANVAYIRVAAVRSVIYVIW